jgi:BlaI family transcriptional regulator, penicillinase repressor
MAPQGKNSRLAAGELDVLNMLWREKSVTILQAQQALGLPIGYTTVQTRLNRLVKKRLVKKSAGRPAKYSAVITPDEVRRGDLDLLVHQVSGGSVTPLVAHLLESDELTADELKELKQLVADAERKARERERSAGKEGDST